MIKNAAATATATAATPATEPVVCPITKPMGAPAKLITSENMEELNFPVIASPKYDGIRCVIHPREGAYTRNFKAIPNQHIWKALSVPMLFYMDGEILATNKAPEQCNDEIKSDFGETQSAVMSRGGTPTFEYYVFDYFKDPTVLFSSRIEELKSKIMDLKSGAGGMTTTCGIEYRWLKIVPHTTLGSVEQLYHYTQDCIHMGFEGAMIRSPEGPYKSGRSTWKQGWLLKYKEIADAEGKIVGFEELLHNMNEAVVGEIGNTKRSSHKANMCGGDTLGNFILATTEWGELRVGTGIGMTQAFRKEVWDNKEDYLGKYVTFKYQKHGMQDKPRFPIFKGIRHD